MEEEQPQVHSRRSYIYESQGGRNRKKLFAIIGGILIVVVVLAIGIFAFSGGEDTQNEEDIFSTPAATVEPTPTEEPTPTPEDEDAKTDEAADADESTSAKDTVDKASGLDRADFTILIQNGSGTAGAAGRLADILKDLGYKISGTENADNFDYTETVIKVSSGNKTLLSLLQKDISGDYTIGETSTDYDGEDDAVIIIGAE